MTATDLDLWKDRAAAVPSSALPNVSIPLHVLLTEAVEVARFFATYWKPELDEEQKVIRYGLDSAAGKSSRIHADTGAEILSLHRAAHEAETRYHLIVDPKTAASKRRAAFLLSEITAALTWHFDDGNQDENDEKLAALDQAHADDPDTRDALAGALDDYATLAEPHRAELDGLGGFEAANLDEARAVAKALREAPAVPVVMSDAAKEAIALRNRVLSLLWERMSAVRAAARFVFRRQPRIVREVTSAYERRSRAASRKKAAERAKGEKATRGRG